MTLSYTTALLLKEKGFPQEGKGEFLTDWTMQEGGINETVYAPSLEELIERCGDDFDRLENSNRQVDSKRNMVKVWLLSLRSCSNLMAFSTR